MFNREFFGAAHYHPNYWIGGIGAAPEPAVSAGGSYPAGRRRKRYILPDGKRLTLNPQELAEYLAKLEAETPKLERKVASTEKRLAKSQSGVDAKKHRAAVREADIRLQNIVALRKWLAEAQAINAAINAAYVRQEAIAQAIADEEEAIQVIVMLT